MRDQSEWLKGTVAGFAGGVAGALAMNQFQRLVASGGDGREAHDAAPGPLREGRGPQPAQAEGDASEDATAQVAETVAVATTGRRLDPETRAAAGSAVHIAFAGLSGAAYGLAAERWPGATAGAGTGFGVALWAVADEALVPAAGLSRGPGQLSWSVLGYGLLSHVVFGLTTDLVRSQVRRALG
jgi:putative membrane protein